MQLLCSLPDIHETPDATMTRDNVFPADLNQLAGGRRFSG